MTVFTLLRPSMSCSVRLISQEFFQVYIFCSYRLVGFHIICSYQYEIFRARINRKIYHSRKQVQRFVVIQVKHQSSLTL